MSTALLREARANIPTDQGGVRRRAASSLFIRMLGNVSHNIFDRINPIGFAKVARGVVALVDYCAELPRPSLDRFKRLRAWNVGDGWRRKAARALLLQVTPDLPDAAEYEANRHRD
jgi:hypothetical protein